MKFKTGDLVAGIHRKIGTDNHIIEILNEIKIVTSVTDTITVHGYNNLFDSEGNVTFPKKSVIYDPNIKKEVSSFFIQPVTLEFAVDFVVNRNHSDLNKDELRQKVEDHFISRINYYSKMIWKLIKPKFEKI